MDKTIIDVKDWVPVGKTYVSHLITNWTTRSLINRQDDDHEQKGTVLFLFLNRVESPARWKHFLLTTLVYGWSKTFPKRFVFGFNIVSAILNKRSNNRSSILFIHLPNVVTLLEKFPMKGKHISLQLVLQMQVKNRE